MITNGAITVYHKEIDEETRLDKWTRTNIDEVWVFKKTIIAKNKGFSNNNEINVRIPYSKNEGLDISKIHVEDIFVPEHIEMDIQTPKDLNEHSVYQITMLSNNKFGSRPHIHIKGE